MNAKTNTNEQAYLAKFGVALVQQVFIHRRPTLFLLLVLLSPFSCFNSLQELALYGDFTLLETMHYFGILHGMKRAEVKQRARFLTELLELPSKGKSIKKLR